MNTLYILSALLLLEIYVIYKISGDDIYCPPMMITVPFFLCCMVGIYRYDDWHFYINDTTLFIILGGITVFSFVFFVTVGTREMKVIPVRNYTDINIKRKIFITLIMLQLIVIYGCYAYVMSIGMQYGGTSIIENIYLYRIYTFVKHEEDGLPKIWLWMYDFCYVISILFSYVFVRDYLLHSRIKKECILYIFLNFVSILLLGGRGEIVFLCISTSVFYYIFFLHKNSWRKIRPYFLIKPILLIMALFTCFALLGQLRQDVNDQNNTNIIEGLSIYFGAELKNLDLYVTEEHNFASENILAVNTMSSMYSFLRIKERDESPITLYDSGFRYVNSVPLGNVATLFKPYYKDYGLYGIVIFPAIIGAFFGVMYRKFMFNDKWVNDLNIYLIIYAMLAYTLILGFFDELFFKNVMSFKFIRIIISLLVLKKVLFVSRG